MNNEQWKAYRNDRIQKIRELKDEQVKHQDKRKKGKKGNSSNYVQKKKNFNCKNKKLQAKAAEKPTPGANVNITFSPVIYGTAPVNPQPFAQPHYAPTMAPQHYFTPTPHIPNYYAPPKAPQHYFTPAPQHPQHCECNFCRK